ncbi:MAG: VWA-like domain-containing protein [Lachnospiraceae bacterium]|nr:VWA-like domain-containing protein [Lachnospiraceae bacterium]
MAVNPGILGRKILLASRNELYLSMRYMDLAFSAFQYEPNDGNGYVGTDGETIFYHSLFLADLYEKDRFLVNRLYLHMVLHCLFRHLWKRQGRDKRYWNLACDIVIESVIDNLNIRAVRMKTPGRRLFIYEELHKDQRVLTAERTYLYLLRFEPEDRMLARLESEFLVDDHNYWYREDNKKKQSRQQNRWEDISRKTQTEMETFGQEAGKNAGNLFETVKTENRERYQYRDFLRRFAVLREEVQVDADSFDYIFYTYGLELYGNMPLIEPQEFKEVKKIEQFVIAIDTSMSCKGELVRSFLTETCAILKNSENFFRQMEIHLIQCDADIQKDDVVHNERELSQYIAQLSIKGGGGTDFRPVFRYVRQLQENGEMTNLKGLIYFTDGQGTYPVKSPGYDTAFVFMREADDTDVKVPVWAMKLIVEPEEFEKNEMKTKKDGGGSDAY